MNANHFFNTMREAINSAYFLILDAGKSFLIKTGTTTKFSVNSDGDVVAAGAMAVVGEIAAGSLAVAGSISGAGPDFTGTATLVGLALSGKLSLTDIATLASAGSAQGDAAAITAFITNVTGADDAKGVILPAAVAGIVRMVYNASTTEAVKVYPATGDTIAGGSANAAILLKEAQLGIFIALDATNWAFCGVLGTAD